MKKLFTSNYARNGSHEKAVSISVHRPRWFPHIIQFLKLAPTWELVKKYKQDQNISEYIQVFEEHLRSLDPRQVIDELPEGTILLCFERPQDFCHRHLVRDWLNRSGQADVTEILKPKERVWGNNGYSLDEWVK